MSCCPGPFYDTEAHANNTLETDHGRLKARLRPMRGLKRDHTATVIVTGHGLSTDIIAASLDAYLVALNKLRGAEIAGAGAAFIAPSATQELP